MVLSACCRSRAVLVLHVAATETKLAICAEWEELFIGGSFMSGLYVYM